MPNKRSCLSSIGLLLSFLGMSGLVLSIISLLPLNGYNIYLNTITILKLLEFEQQRTKEQWQFSQDAKLYFIFLLGSLISSLFEILLTFITCLRHQERATVQPLYSTISSSNSEEEEEDVESITAVDTMNINSTKNLTYYHKSSRVTNKKSSFIRLTCCTLIIQITFSLLGSHIVYRRKSDINVIPSEIQYNSYISCVILWLNYLSLTLFAFIILFASFFVLIGAYQTSRQEKQRKSAYQDEESRPLII